MKLFLRVVLAILVVLGLFACAPVTPVSQGIGSAPEATADGFYPLSTRTGIATIDDILEVVAESDTTGLRSLVEFTNAPCTRRDGLGGPPKCREEEAEGTAMDVLPFLGAEGSFIRRTEIGDWQGIDVTGLYAIFEVSPAVTAEEYYPVGRYAILFLGKPNQPAVALRIGEKGIVRVDHVFDSSPEALNALVQSQASDVILAPPGR
jgi:hypothetical protein